MKIDSTTNSKLSDLKGGVARTQQDSSVSSGAAAQTSGATAQGAASSGGDANVSLSGLSSDLRNLATSGSADIDTAHVESIKQAIQNGSLSIDTGKIADGILETTRNLLQAQPAAGGN